jgi:hypothetical protein
MAQSSATSACARRARPTVTGAAAGRGAHIHVLPVARATALAPLAPSASASRVLQRCARAVVNAALVTLAVLLGVVPLA